MDPRLVFVLALFGLLLAVLSAAGLVVAASRWRRIRRGHPADPALEARIAERLRELAGDAARPAFRGAAHPVPPPGLDSLPLATADAPPTSPPEPLAAGPEPPVTPAALPVEEPLIARGRLPSGRARRARGRSGTADPRGRLARDASAVLLVFAIVGLAVLGLGALTRGAPTQGAPTQGGQVPTPTPPAGSPVAAVSPPWTGATGSPIVPGESATPTPLAEPLPTLAPLPAATASPAPTPRRSPTPAPTHHPTPAPTPSPTLAPPTPTPAPPHAAFTPTCPAPGYTIHFDASASTGATNWSWNFDTGITGSGVTADVTYPATPAAYHVVLTVSGPNGPDNSTFQTVNVPCTP